MPCVLAADDGTANEPNNDKRSIGMLLPAEAKIAAMEVPPNEPYTLGPGDQLNIFDYGFADADKPPLNIHTTVLPDGTITVYPLGVISVEGMTLKQVNDMVNKGHSPPETFVTISKARPVAIKVLGDVVSPGVYTTEAGLFTSKAGVQPLDTGGDDFANSVTVPQGYVAQNQISTITSNPPKVNQLSIMTALQMAGGVHDTADITHIRLTRAFTGTMYFINLWTLAVEGDISQDVPLRDGDTIFVSRGGPAFDSSSLGVAAERTRRVRVFGAVTKPGIYDLRPDDDLYSAIAKAGGYSTNASVKSVILTRKSRDGTVKSMVVQMPRKNLIGMMHDKGEAIGRVPIRNGDVVVVTESTLKRMGPKTAGGLLTAASALGIVLLNNRIH